MPEQPIKPVLVDLQNYIAQMAPHQKERKGGRLLIRSLHEIESLLAEIERLKLGIKEHRDQKADDRCIEDDDRLYALLGDGVKCDRRVGDKTAMLENCARFIDRRCEGGHWPSYKELTQQLASAQKSNP